MKKNEIKIGSTYTAKVSNRIVPVRIDAENPHGGWDATNLVTKKKVRIKSARRLRSRCRESTKADSATKAATGRPTTKATRANTAATDAKTTPKATTEAKPVENATRANDAKPGGKPGKRIGILDAAAMILAKVNGSMDCKTIVNIAIESGVWKTNDKTPSATLYAAITREIAKKGKDAWFKKVDRGLFAFNGKEA